MHPNPHPWLAGSVWYHLYPLGFLGAEPTNPAPGATDGHVEHRLPRLHAWLDYLVDLGVDTLQLGPVFESETHGYDTVDYRYVDRRLGDEGDLVALFDACHQRGLRVVLDGVFNHVARSFPAFRDVVERQRSSPYAAWFKIDFDRPGPDGFRYADFEGHAHLVQLNHDHPAVVDLLVDVACSWLDRGADGWRLDAAYAVPSRFWAAFSAAVRDRHPDAVLLAEVIHGDYRRYVTRTGLDSVTQYELWKAVWSSINDANLFELAHALGRHAEFCEELVPATFVGNHDVTRIASQLADPRHLGHAVAVLFTVPGVPVVYAGDEQRFTGVKRDEAGGDDDIRPAFPAGPDQLDAPDPATHALYRALIALRRRHPGLATGRVEVVHVANEQLAYRVTGEGVDVVVALNLADAGMDLRLPGSVSSPTVVAGSGSVDGGTVSVPAHSWAVVAGS